MDINLMRSRIIKVSNSKEFIGIKGSKDGIKVYVPSTFEISILDSELQRDIINFLKSIELAKRADLDTEENIDNVGEIWPVNSYIWLLKDYINNRNRPKDNMDFSSKFNGTIDWVRTMKRVPMLIDNQVIFNEFISKNVSSQKDKIYEIYLLCIKISYDRIGWLYSHRINIEGINRSDITKFRTVIKHEMNNTFVDIERVRLTHMLKVVEGLNQNSYITSNFVYGVNNYYRSFEIMLDNLLGNVSATEKKKFYPDACWYLYTGLTLPSSRLRPDTIFRKGNYIYIIDAKMYEYGSSRKGKHLPSTTSLQKQITYSDFVVEKIDNKALVRNIFILPYNKTEWIDDKISELKIINDGNFAYFGKGKVSWFNNLLLHKNVFGFFIDFNYLISMNMSIDNKVRDEIFATIEEQYETG